ncbi:MAG: hypothetical protein NTU57_02990 [Candidatus Aenigmarchaeota archaeon]|nr:hypothetical protein [Candidatus Aenigmarchaeota archaeon]
MKKLFVMAIALLVIGVTGAAVMADETLGSQGQARVKIHTMGALGYGIATSQSNAMDFEMIKVGIAGVSVTDANGTETIVKTGVLHFGETKYRLKDVVIGNGTATANVYDVNGTTQLGSLSLNSYVKGNGEVWAGSLTLNGVTYNAYVIQAPKVWKAEEVADNVKDYCKNNPVKCKATIKAVGGIICDPEKEGISCADKIKTFCEQNPTDNRCKVVNWAYCKLHLDDANCRADIIEKCKNITNGTISSDNAICDKLANMYNKYTEKRADVMNNAPEWLKNVRERVKDRLQRGENVDNAPDLNSEGQ